MATTVPTSKRSPSLTPQTDLPATKKSKSADVKVQTAARDDIDAWERHVTRDGAVIVKGLFSAEQVAVYKAQHDAVLKEVDEKVSKAERKEKAYLLTLGEKRYTMQGYYDIQEGTKLLDLCHGRLDFTYKMDEGAFASPAYHASPPVQQFMERMLKSDFAHYAGAVPSRGKSENGAWHRDTYTLFDEQPGLDANLPPYYYTVLVPLDHITADLGPTQLHVGSHKMTYEEAKENAPLASVTPLEPGDALVFDGRCIHRGLANNQDRLRRMLYFVWHKKWYSDYGDYDFADGYSFTEKDAVIADRNL